MWFLMRITLYLKTHCSSGRTAFSDKNHDEQRQEKLQQVDVQTG